MLRILPFHDQLPVLSSSTEELIHVTIPAFETTSAPSRPNRWPAEYTAYHSHDGEDSTVG